MGKDNKSIIVVSVGHWHEAPETVFRVLVNLKKGAFHHSFSKNRKTFKIASGT
jgi:hypothetical protein